MRLDLDLRGWWLGRDLERWWMAVSGHDAWWSAIIRSLSNVTFHHGYKFFSSKKLIWVCSGLRCEWCDVGWLEPFGFEEDEWAMIGGVVVDGGCWVTRLSPLGVWVLFWNFFDLGRFEVWCLMIFWLSLSCLIVLCDVGINWVYLGLIIWCSEIFVFFSFLNVM